MTPHGFPSDQGYQDASAGYRQLLHQKQMHQSMSRKAICYDNAHGESFWATLKTEGLPRQNCVTRAEARLAIFSYVHTFYNRVRLDSALGYKSPVDFEQQTHQTNAQLPNFVSTKSGQPHHDLGTRSGNRGDGTSTAPYLLFRAPSKLDLQCIASTTNMNETPDPSNKNAYVASGRVLPRDERLRIRFGPAATPPQWRHQRTDAARLQCLAVIPRGGSGTLTEIDLDFFNNVSGDARLQIFSGRGTQGNLRQTLTVPARVALPQLFKNENP